jgi:hypothetical protein
MEADARVDAVETEAKKRIDVIRRENEDKVLSLEADLTQAKNRADRAEQWVMLIRREIEEHLMPAMRDAPKPTSSVARRLSSTVPTPSRSLASIWIRLCGFESPPLQSQMSAASGPAARETTFTGRPLMLVERARYRE